MKIHCPIKYIEEPKMGDKKVKRIFLLWPYYNNSDECYYWLEWVDMQYCYHFTSFLLGMGWNKWQIINKPDNA